MADSTSIFDALDEEYQRREAEAGALPPDLAKIAQTAPYVAERLARQRGWTPTQAVDPESFALDSAKRLLDAAPDTPDEDVLAIKAWAERRKGVNVVREETAARADKDMTSGAGTAFDATVVPLAGGASDATFGIPEFVARKVVAPAVTALTGAEPATKAEVAAAEAQGRKAAPFVSDLSRGIGATGGAMTLMVPAAGAMAPVLVKAGLSEGAAATVANLIAGAAHGGASDGSVSGAVRGGLFMGGAQGLGRVLRGATPGAARYLASEAAAGGTASVISQLAAEGHADPTRVLADGVVNALFGLGGARAANRAKARDHVAAEVAKGREIPEIVNDDVFKAMWEEARTYPDPTVEAASTRAEFDARLAEVEASKPAIPALDPVAEARATAAEFAAKPTPDPVAPEKPVSVAPVAPVEAPARPAEVNPEAPKSKALIGTDKQGKQVWEIAGRFYVKDKAGRYGTAHPEAVKEARANAAPPVEAPTAPEAPIAKTAGAPGRDPSTPTGPVSALINAAKAEGGRIADAWQAFRDTAVGFTRRALPRMTAANPEASAAASAKASSPVAAKTTADRIVSEVIKPGVVGDLEFGGALTEANLRDVRAGYRQTAADATASADATRAEIDALRTKAAEARRGGKMVEWKDARNKIVDAAKRLREATAQAEEASKAAAEVKTLIGSEGFPFKTEADYQAFRSNPEVQAAVARHKELFETNIESLYREQQGIKDAVGLPERGSEMGGARINLKRMEADEKVEPGKIVFRTPSDNPSNVRNRKSPFGRRATGASEGYDISYQRIIENGLARQYEGATWKRTQEALVAGGDAVLIKQGEKPPQELKGQPVTRLDVGGLGDKTLYVRRDLMGELSRVANVNPDKSAIGKFLKPVNIAALTGPADAFTNIVNVFGATAAYPSGKGGALAQTALKLSPLHIPVKVGQLIKTALEPATKQMAELQELAEVGAGRLYEKADMRHPGGWLKSIGNSVDRAGRIIMLRAYKARVARGEEVYDRTKLRDWVNLLGNYTTRLQGPVTRMLADTGVNPFIVAGRRAVSMGFDVASLNPRTIGLTKKYFGTMVANWLGGMTTIAALNLITNGSPVPDDVPIGHLKYGKKDGKPESINLLPFFGLNSALSVTGVGKAIEDVRAGHDLDMAFGDMIVKAINAQLNSLSGPASDFVWQAASGKPVGFDHPRISPVTPGGRGEQFVSDAKAALLNLVQLAKPVFEGGKAATGNESEFGEAMKRLGGYFTSRTGMPARARETRVSRRAYANLNEFKMDLRRRISFGEASGAAVAGWLEKQLDDEDIPAKDKAEIRKEILRWNARR